MESETYIFDKIKKIRDDDIELKDKLNQVAGLLNEKWNISICFCQIIGNKRWSFFAGLEVLFAGLKEKINDHWGFMLSNLRDENKKSWNEIKNLIVSFDFS